MQLKKRGQGKRDATGLTAISVIHAVVQLQQTWVICGGVTLATTVLASGERLTKKQKVLPCSGGFQSDQTNWGDRSG